MVFRHCVKQYVSHNIVYESQERKLKYESTTFNLTQHTMTLPFISQPTTTDEGAFVVHQQILLDQNAHIIESDDTLFSTRSLHDNSLKATSPFIKSIWEDVLRLRLDYEEIHFPCVESDFMAQKQWYIYTFSKIILNNEIAILWSIVDYSNMYHSDIQSQQHAYDNFLSTDSRRN